MLSFQNLQDGYQETPLIDFKGNLQSYDPQPPDQFGNTRVVFSFIGVEVIESIEPYPFPIATIRIKYSNKKNSQWGILAASAKKVLGDEADVPNLVGKDQRWRTREHSYGTNRQGEEMTGMVWDVLEVEGVGSTGADAPATVPAITRVLELLDGKTLPQFHQVVFADPVVKADSQLMASVMGNTLIPTLVESGQVSLDDNGIYHVQTGEV